MKVSKLTSSSLYDLDIYLLDDPRSKQEKGVISTYFKEVMLYVYGTIIVHKIMSTGEWSSELDKDEVVYFDDFWGHL